LRRTIARRQVGDLPLQWRHIRMRRETVARFGREGGQQQAGAIQCGQFRDGDGL